MCTGISIRLSISRESLYYTLMFSVLLNTKKKSCIS